MLFAVTLPWAIRKRFPVNSFSANWKRNNNDGNDKNNTENKKNRIKLGTEKESKSLWLINAMYRFKKWQYIFYKHTILHGLNVSVAVLSSTRRQQGVALTLQWRIFYLLLNTSYVMEFFLQSLVRRGVLTQRFMMVLNILLMASSSLAAMDSNVLGQVRVEAALLSLTLNFSNRGHDILNTMATFVLIQLMIQNNFIA